MASDGSGASRGQAGGGSGGSNGPGGVVVETRDKFSVFCSWKVAGYAKIRQRAIWSNYFEVGGYDCRLLIYPGGDSQAVPGYVSVYLQLTDPRHSGGKWECFCSYQLSVVNQKDVSKSVSRDSWHRYSAKKKSHGWCDFAPACTITDTHQGFMLSDTIVITADITVLHETSKFSRDDDASQLRSSYVMSGTFNWRVHNFSLFMDMIKTQKIMSPTFPAGDCCLQMSVYQLTVEGTEYLSLCLESKDPDKSEVGERTCWSLFRISVLNQNGKQHRHRDSYGRFTADSESGDNTSLGWNEYMKMQEFTDEVVGFLVDNTAVFQVTYHVLMEQSSFSRILDRVGSTNHATKRKGANYGGDHYQGKFVWKIENFTRLKEMLRKRKITGLCIKSRRFQVGGKDCRLIVYPRGQSQPPSSLSMFLEVTKRGTVDDAWSCFVSHRLSVLSQSSKSGVDRTVVKESQNRYSKTAKDWGWREFISLTSLFDQELGFLVSDGISFQAEVLVLKEVFEKRDTLALPSSTSKINNQGPSVGFLWRMDNFSGFREVMETRKIYSQYFKVGDCSLRIGMYDSFDMLCVYLESENSGTDPDDSFWVRFRIAVINQKHPSLTHWKESSLCTRTWSNSVLQLLKVSQLTDPKAGYLQREGIQVACDVIECSSWFEFGDSDLTVWEEVTSTEDMGSSSSKRTALTTVNDVSDDESSESNSKSDVEEMFQCVFSGRQGEDSMIPDLDTSMLRASCSKFVGDAGAVSSFIAGLRHCLSDPAKVQRLVMPAQGGTSSNLLELLLNIRGLASPLIDMLLDIMVECALSIGSGITEQSKQDSSSGTEDTKECTSSTSESNVEEDQVSRDPPSGASTPMMHIPSFLGPAMSCLNGKTSLMSCGRDESSSLTEASGVQRSDDLQHISPMIRFGTFAPGAVPGLDKNPRSRKAESRAWRVLGKLGSEQALTVESSTTGDPPVSSASFMVPPSGSRTCLASEDPKSRLTIPNPPAGSGASCVSLLNHKESRSNQLRKKARPTGTGGSESPGKLPSGERRVMHAEVLTLLVGALTSADFDHDDDDGSEAGSNEDDALDVTPSQQSPSSNLHKISLLLSSLPVSVLPDVIMLVPMLLRPSEHTAVAGFLLGWLSEVGRQNPDIEQLVRPAVLSSLGPLKISDAIADKVVEAALKALSLCPTAEIPAAVVLILKLSSEHVGSGGAGINGGLRGVRDFLKHNVDGVSENIFVAVQLAVMRHSKICDALHADIRLECEQMCGRSQRSTNETSLPSPNPRSLVDTMVLMDILRSEEKRDDVLTTLYQCISLGFISSADISTVLDRRRMYHKFWRDMDQLPTPDSTAPDGSWVSEGSTGSEEETQSDMPFSNDEFQSILDLNRHLLQFKDVKVNKFLSDLYNFLFEVVCDFSLHEQLLQSLISQASTSGNSNQEGALDILLGIIQKFPYCAARTISLLVSDISAQVKDYKAVKQKATSLDQDKKNLEARLKELSSKTNTERKELRSRIAELEKKLTKACQSKQEDLKKVISEKADLQEKVRGLEGQIEWVQAERNEEQARATECASAVQDLQRQLCESESQVGQLKKQRRDDQRFHTREKNTLSEKLSSLEANKQQSDELISELKIRVTQSSADIAQRDKKLNDLENTIAQSAREMQEVRATNEKQAAELRESQEHATKIAEDLQSKSEQCSQLRGKGLEKMDVSDLQELIAIQEQTIRAATDILQQRGVLPPATPTHDPSPPAPMLGLGMSSESNSQVLPMSQQRWPTTFRNEPDHPSSMFRSPSDASGFVRERLAPFPGVPPRGPGLGGSISSVSYHQTHPKIGFGSGLGESPSMNRLMRGTSDYGGTIYQPRPPLDDSYIGYHMPKHPHYEAHPHESVPGPFLYQSRPHMGPWHGNQEPGLVVDPAVGGQPQMIAQPLRNGYVNGLFGSGSLTSGKKIW